MVLWRGWIVVALAAFALFAGTASLSASNRAPGPDPAVREWPTWPFEAACGELAFDPVAVFGGPTGVESGSRPSERALGRFLRSERWVRQMVPLRDWRLLAETEDQAEFASGRLTRRGGPATMAFERGDAGWKWSGLSSGCDPRSIVDGLEVVTWTLAADKPWPRKGARKVWIRLGPGGCSGGRSQNARARKPIFRWIDGRLAMVMTLRPLPPGGYTCQGTSDPAMPVRLPRPFGRVRLFDGGAYPPRDVRKLRREGAYP